MSRALRWILLAVILGAGTYLVVAVDFDGATLLDRIRGRMPSPQPQAEPALPGDQLTEEDRQGLDRLVESKLKEQPEGEARP